MTERLLPRRLAGMLALTAGYADGATLEWVGGPLDGSYRGRAAIGSVWSRFAQAQRPLQSRVGDIVESAKPRGHKLRHVSDGETGEMAALIELHIPALRRFAWALLRDGAAADDLVQDCLERAISRWHLRRHEGSLKPWLFTILHNLFISGRRGATRRGPHQSLDHEEADGLAFADPVAGSAVQARLTWRDALTGIAALPEEQRTVLLLVGVEDFSYEETARLTGVPIGTVMSRLSRGSERLRRLIDGRDLSRDERTSLRRVKS